MRSILLFCSLLCLPLVSLSEGRAPTTAPLLGGKYIDPTTSPYAFILIFDFQKAAQIWAVDKTAPIPGPVSLCSGTLVGKRYVLTAAHCIRESFGARGHLSWIGGKWRWATAVESHPKYVLSDISSTNTQQRMMNLYTDVAVITLLEEVNDVAPLPILTDEQFQVGEYITVTGFGMNETSHTEANPLKNFRTATLQVMDLDESAFATYYSRTLTAACSGDSGGPAIKEIGDFRAIAGVTSQGNSTTVANNGQCLRSSGDLDLFPLLQSTHVLPFLRKFSGIEFLSGKFARFYTSLPTLQGVSSQGTTARNLKALQRSARKIITTQQGLRRYADSKRLTLLNKIVKTCQSVTKASNLQQARRLFRKVVAYTNTLQSYQVI